VRLEDILAGFALIALSGCSGSWIPESSARTSRAWDLVRMHRDRALIALTQDERRDLDRQVELLGVAPRPEFSGCPDFVTALRNDRGLGRWVLVWLSWNGKVPSFSRVRVAVLDDDGRLLTDNAFLSGWRHLDFEGIDRCADEGRPADLLRISTWSMVQGHLQQFYALVGDRVEIVRLEAKGEPEPLKINYASPNHTVGPVVPPLDEKDCVDTLESGTWARQLSVLAWLGGIHWDGSNPQVWHEDQDAVRAFSNLHSSPRVQMQVARLTQSPDPWIRHAANVIY